MGKPCVAGAEGIKVDVKLRQAKIGEKILHEGDYITIDGGTGNVYQGIIPTVEPTFSDELKTLLAWADIAADLKVMANADTPEAALKALDYGAMGIGLCRTERMFNASDRLPVVVEMILANTREEREAALSKLLPIQRNDFKGILTIMAPKPVTIRLLDPPIHEFLPTQEELKEEIRHLQHLRETANGINNLYHTLGLLNEAKSLEVHNYPPFNEKGVELIEQAIVKKEQMLKKVRDLYEVNPMLGHRGVRLGLTYPEIYKMQVQAILEATAECQAANIDVHPEIMVPQVCTAEELVQVKAYVDELKEKVEKEKEVTLSFKFGTMIEVVRACMEAEELAKEAEFFSFGTNDLTQATFSFSREDAENKFLPLYAEKNILHNNPFEVLDQAGVGKLMKIAVEWGRKTKPHLKIGICGEHGGQPDSIRFCHSLGLTYVSCSGPRVPVARLAAAHAKLGESKNSSL
jgi:pyruvate,orthophosphate dikinase